METSLSAARLLLAQSDKDRARLLADRLRRIGDQIDDDLVELAAVAEERRHRLELALDADRAQDARAQHLQRFANRGGEVEELMLQRILATEGEDLLDEVARTVCALQDEIEITLLGSRLEFA